mmetsp:Transcript_111156/g.237546  ORF Transcript_111156/g.237546 Transcript_111156/m.237546 type:complete len:205 (-) Transcript_111156:116-730(-)
MRDRGGRCLTSAAFLFLAIGGPAAIRREAPHRAASTNDHGHVLAACSSAVVLQRGLRPHVLLQHSDDATQVIKAKACVAVGEDGEANRHVWVREFRLVARLVLAHKWHRQEATRARHLPIEVVPREEAVRDAVHLAQKVRQKHMKPLRCKVQELHHRIRSGAQFPPGGHRRVLRSPEEGSKLRRAHGSINVGFQEESRPIGQMG